MPGDVHMPCGCPYPPIGDHRPCVHGDCGHCEGPCIKVAVARIEASDARIAALEAAFGATLATFNDKGAEHSIRSGWVDPKRLEAWHAVWRGDQ
jgi:hypothetical protein